MSSTTDSTSITSTYKPKKRTPLVSRFAVTGESCSYCDERHTAFLSQCTSCRSAWYCTRDHQKLHYKQHKTVCKSMQAVVKYTLEVEKGNETEFSLAQWRHHMFKKMELLKKELGVEQLNSAQRNLLLYAPKCNVCLRTTAKPTTDITQKTKKSSSVSDSSRSGSMVWRPLKVCGSCRNTWFCCDSHVEQCVYVQVELLYVQ